MKSDSASAMKSQSCSWTNEELESLVRQDETWERRQKAFFAVHARWLPHGSGRPSMESLDELESADREWKAAKAQADRIVQEIREGRR